MHNRSTTALIDLDDTLLEYRIEEEAGEAALASAMGVCMDGNWAQSYRWAKDAERGQPPDGDDRLERRIHMLVSALGIEVSVDDLVQLRRAYVDARVRAVTELPGASALLKHIRSTFETVLICTIGVHDLQVSRIRAAGFYDNVDDVLVSDVRGVGKEDWSKFLGTWFQPSRLYAVISDREDPDLSSALRAGMFTVGIGPQAGSNCHVQAENPQMLSAMLADVPLVNLMERHYERDANA